MTPEEAAKPATWPNNDDKRVQEFLVDASARVIQAFIHLIPINAHSCFFHLARTALDVRLAEDATKQSDRFGQQMGKLLEIVEAQRRLAEKLDRQTATLISLTRSLKVFTFVVIVLTVGLLMEGGVQFFEFHQRLSKTPQNSQQTNQADNANQHEQNPKK